MFGQLCLLGEYTGQHYAVFFINQQAIIMTGQA